VYLEVAVEVVLTLVQVATGAVELQSEIVKVEMEL
jgi:hypothetical protein